MFYAVAPRDEVFLCDSEPIESDRDGDVTLVEFLVVAVVVILGIVIAARIEQAFDVGRFEARKDCIKVDGLPLAGDFFEFVEIDRGPRKLFSVKSSD